MSGSGYLHWSYDPFEKMVIFPPNPLMVMSQTCVDIICLPCMLIFRGFDVGHLLTTSTPSMMEMDVALMSAIAWVDTIVIAFRYSFVGLPHNARAAAANDGPGLNLIA
jgi:hypothetical protein